jgi:hypothetical protein
MRCFCGSLGFLIGRWPTSTVVIADTTIGGGCFLGIEVVRSASKADLTQAYGVFAQEARAIKPDYMPSSRSEIGLPRPSNTPLSRFGSGFGRPTMPPTDAPFRKGSGESQSRSHYLSPHPWWTISRSLSTKPPGGANTFSAPPLTERPMPWTD